jgi:orotate phosphoribosyltransferase-like protein
VKETATYRQQKALELRKAGKTYREIGEALGVTKERAMQLMKQAGEIIGQEATDTKQRGNQHVFLASGIQHDRDCGIDRCHGDRRVVTAAEAVGCDTRRGMMKDLVLTVLGWILFAGIPVALLFGSIWLLEAVEDLACCCLKRMRN